MRTIKELLQVMLDNQKYFVSGLCNLVDNICLKDLISMKEHRILLNYVKENKPSTFSSFERFKQEICAEAYWWKKGNINPRIKWLKKHIKQNS